MTTILLLALLQVGVPVACLAWVGLGRTHSRLSWWLVAAASAGGLIGGRLAGLWLFPPHWVPLTLLLALAGALIRGRSSLRDMPWRLRSTYARAEAGIAVCLIAVSVAWIDDGVAGRRLPDGRAAELRFPLRNGTYLIVNGGSTETTNPHVATLRDAKYSAWRGQSYGADIIKTNALGLRASGIAPAAPERYAIFGDEVHAPCAGTVARTDDGAKDMQAGQRDRSRMAGNYVLLDCGDLQVLLGHLQRGSVRVNAGDIVTPADVIGRVGNSGNSDEPHLHVHAQRPSATPSLPFAGDPVAMKVDGHALSRNDIVRRAAGETTTPTSEWAPSVMAYAQIIACLAALVMLLVSQWAPRVGRLLFVPLFAWAAQVNMRTAIGQPEVYLDYAPLAVLAFYRDFILGFFARHITLLVGTVAIAQAGIAILILMPRPFPHLALVAAIIFLLAIAPLGVGSGFPSTVIMALAATVLLSDPART